MKHSLRTKLIVSFVAVIATSGIVTVWVGTQMIGDEIIGRAQEKVRTDLNSAREIYTHRVDRISEVVRLTSIRFFLRQGLTGNNPEIMENELMKIRETEGLDILTITDKDGVVVFRARNPEVRHDAPTGDEILTEALVKEELVAGTQIVTSQELEKEGTDLMERAHIGIIPTPRARPRPEDEETSGIACKAAAPVFDYDGTLIGVLYGATLLNRNYEIVDAVKAVVYQGETYKGRDTGTVTIFQGDLRISTNVLDSSNSRAIGTRVSEEVYNQVIIKGAPWMARAFVVNDWYITAYEPLKSIRGEIIGMLYVGLLEAPYTDLRNRVVLTFSGIAVATVVLLSIVVYFTTSSIVSPLRRLLHATERIARGYLAYRVKVTSDDELGQLARSFNTMTEELEKTTADYVELNQKLEEQVLERTKKLEEAQDQLVQTEKLTSLGKMAAGIAHEINNPLTSILINSHLAVENLKDKEDLDGNLKLIIDETTRCSEIVRGLLEFSRQTAPRLGPVNVNHLIDQTLLLLKSHVMAKRVNIRLDPGDNLPTMIIDMNKMKQVFTNIILNALDAMIEGGTLTIRSRLSGDKQSVNIEFEDTGCGIPDDVLVRVFDPFFSTKETGGTGLGLAVSYGIVELHKGKIDIQSRVGIGTIVTVTLPISAIEPA
ncbi:MAG: cache domain-containing protein [Candidatus Eisenbacteria bacterium]